FQNNMGVGAADAEGADPRTSRLALRLPGLQRGVDVDRATGEVDLRVRLAEMEARRQEPALQGQHGLDQPRDTRGSVEVPEVGLDRAQSAITLSLRPRTLRSPRAQRRGEGGDLDRISQPGAGAVRLDV